eukprot:TRINITY_DN2989_c0_g1_i2.p1 TRINITY_DN2989_c0_g1~~TRINITY_DN2989_c0_g1_i2.p1  ORF type:complete len:288 (-),score=44.75 TRINITY_DN2989_c0_g1_i2:792-1655(-)
MRHRRQTPSLFVRCLRWASRNTRRILLGLCLLMFINTMVLLGAHKYLLAVLLTNLSSFRSCVPLDNIEHRNLDARWGVVTLYANRLGPVGELSDFNKRQYTARHGYEMVVENDQVANHKRRISWSKVLALKKHLARFDWLMWVDVDTLFMDLEMPLSRFQDDRYDVMMSSNENGVNAGVIFVRNTPWGHQFLDTWWNQTKYIRRAGRGSGDQHALRHLMKKAEFRSHVKTFPQCAFNSRVEMRVWSWYHFFMKGDFLVHFAGLSPRRKLILMQNFVDGRLYDFRDLN